jgi:hypothetical protein
MYLRTATCALRPQVVQELGAWRLTVNTANHRSLVLQHYGVYESLSPSQVTGKHLRFITIFPKGSDCRRGQDKHKNVDYNSLTESLGSLTGIDDHERRTLDYIDSSVFR